MTNNVKNIAPITLIVISVLLFFSPYTQGKKWNTGISADNQAVRSKKSGIKVEWKWNISK